MLDFIAQMFDIFINGFYRISFSCIKGANYLHKKSISFLGRGTLIIGMDFFY